MTEYAVVAFGALTGIALSSAVGFRIFLPFLVTGVAIRLNVLSVANDFQWLSSWPALALFAAATITEVLAYYIPVVDHALDVIGGPAAVIAGTMLTASMVVGMDEWLRWALALIAGGGIAGSLHIGKSLVRGASTATTGGLGNPLVATAEVFGATIASILALMVPVLVVVVAGIIVIVAVRALWRRRRAT